MRIKITAAAECGAVGLSRGPGKEREEWRRLLNNREDHVDVFLHGCTVIASPTVGGGMFGFSADWVVESVPDGTHWSLINGQVVCPACALAGIDAGFLTRKGADDE